MVKKTGDSTYARLLVQHNSVSDELNTARTNGALYGEELDAITLELSEVKRAIDRIAFPPKKTPDAPETRDDRSSNALKRLNSQLKSLLTRIRRKNDGKKANIREALQSIHDKISSSYQKHQLQNMQILLNSGTFPDQPFGPRLSHPWYNRIRGILSDVIKLNHRLLTAIEVEPLCEMAPMVSVVQANYAVVKDIVRRIGEKPFVANEFLGVLYECKKACDLQEDARRAVLDTDSSHPNNYSASIDDSHSVILASKKQLEELIASQRTREADLEAYVQVVNGYTCTNTILKEINILQPEDLRKETLGQLLASEPWNIRTFNGEIQKFDLDTPFGGYALGVARATYGTCQYAVKVFKCDGQDNSQLQICVRIIREIKALLSLKHEHIVTLEGIWTIESSFPAIVTRWCSGGDLRTYIQKNQVPLYDKLRFTLEIAQALQYLHGRESPVVHADIKCSNVLLNDGHALLADFGLSRHKNQTHGLTTGASSYTTAWRAPEITLANKTESLLPHALEFPTPMSDMYAFGCLFMELVIVANPLSSSTALTTDIPSTSSIRDKTGPKTPADEPHPNEIVQRRVFDKKFELASSSDSKHLPIVNTHWAFMLQCWDRSIWVRPSATAAVEELTKLCAKEHEFLLTNAVS